MEETINKVKRLVNAGKVRISEHAYDELADDKLTVRELAESMNEAAIVEDYPEYPKGPCVLLLHKNQNREPIHAVWGIPSGKEEPAVLVTAYRPDPKRWEGDFIRRKTHGTPKKD